MVKNKSEILITVLTTSSVRNRTPNLPSVFIDGFDLKKKNSVTNRISTSEHNGQQ